MIMIEVHYHLDKANKVTDASSEKHVLHAVTMEKILEKLERDLCDLEMEVVIRKLPTLTNQPNIMELTRGGQLADSLIEE